MSKYAMGFPPAPASAPYERGSALGLAECSPATAKSYENAPGGAFSAEDFVLMSLGAGTRLGPYEIEAPLGSGAGVGVVNTQP